MRNDMDTGAPKWDGGEDPRHGDGWSGDIGGCVPVQGFGVVDGLPWYFRARYETWSFRLADTADGDPIAVKPGCSGSGWFVEREFNQGFFAAGWMSTADAWGFVMECIEEHRAGMLPRVNDPCADGHDYQNADDYTGNMICTRCGEHQ